MGIQSLQRFIETNCPGACVPVDLLKIARSISVRRRQPPFYQQNQRLCLVVDGECCLDRLYGGYFSDWVCGGQWNRMVQFLSVLIQTIQNNNIELAVFFNGGLEPQRINEWIKIQLNDRKKINQVLKHVATKATPPPKIWWIPPVSLRTCLRMALRHLNVTVVCTMDDHHQEVIAFCRENNFHGLMAEDAEYAVFDPPRYFSSEQLKLTYKGSLETREFILDEVAKCLNLHPNRFCILAALLGNYLLTEEDLLSFHKVLHSDNKNKQNNPDSLIKDIVEFVRNLPTIDNLDVIGAQVFGQNKQEKIQKFKQCVQYYLNGTKDGFLHYRPAMQGRRQEPGCYPSMKNLSTVTDQPKQYLQSESTGAYTKKEALKGTSSNTAISPDGEDPFPQPAPNSSKFASETAESELSSLTAYNQATGSYNKSSAPQIVIEPPTSQSAVFSSELGSEMQSQLEHTVENDINQSQQEKVEDDKYDGTTDSHGIAGSCSSPHHINGGLLLSSSASSSSNSSSPNRLSPEVSWSSNVQQSKNASFEQHYQELPKLPSVPPEVLRTACERHQKGLMSPWIYQILSQGEIKIPVIFEEDIPRDLPSPVLLYRSLRQMVYAILFNLHHHQFMAKQKEKDGSVEKIPDIVIKEWVWDKVKQYQSADYVVAVPLGWAVPTVQRLWFGSSVNDKKRRMRAFLTCMRSGSPLMLNTAYVPQHLLVICCILRYIMSDPEHPILRKQELDAFLAQAVSPHLMNAQHTQNMQLPLITSRGIHLAAMFMQGVECALFANDACGAPIPWLMCCPWLFFDGKLFHHKLLKANGAKNLIEVCDGQISQVAKVERMRTAILDGLQVEFARPPPPILPRPAPPPPLPGFRGPPFVATAGSGLNIRGRGRGVIGRQRVIARGGQLEIAGVVVGSWGANYGQMPRNRNLSLPPQVTSVGGLRRFGAGQPSGLGHGYIPRRPPLTRIRRPGPIFTQLTKKKQNKKNKLTKDKVQDNNADTDGFIKNGSSSESSIVPGNLSVPLDGAGDGPETNAENATKANTEPFASAKDGNVRLPDIEKSSPISQLNDNHSSVLLGSQIQEDCMP